MPALQYHIETFGCQMNVYDSELVAGLLKKCGYSETKKINNADLMILISFHNTIIKGYG